MFGRYPPVDLEIIEAVNLVKAGRVDRVAKPGKWRVFKSASGLVEVERF